MGIAIEWSALLHRVRKHLGPVLGMGIVYHDDILVGVFSSSTQKRDTTLNYARTISFRIF